MALRIWDHIVIHCLFGIPSSALQGMVISWYVYKEHLHICISQTLSSKVTYSEIRLYIIFNFFILSVCAFYKSHGCPVQKRNLKKHHLIMLLYLHRWRGWWSGQCFPKWPWEHYKTDVEQAKEHHWQRKHNYLYINQNNWKHMSINSNFRTAYFYTMNI